MAPTRMKLRVRRRDNTAAAAEGGGAQEDEQRRRREGGGLGGSRRKNASKASAAAAAASSPPPPSSASARAVMAAAAEEASPDSKCPICLDRFNNLAYLDRCLHRFCFPCIQEWSHNKAECPLCKQPFASILHSVRAEDDFKEYTLRPPPANSSVAATVAMVAAMASAARSNHQMRLMLRRHRVADGGETTARRRRRARGERGARRAEERPGVWEWYLDSPPLPLRPLPHHPAISPSVVEDGEEQRIRAAAERGVIFEGLAGLEGAVTPVAPNDRASRRLMTRLAARQRLQREGGTVRRLRERETVALRRALYRCGIRVRGVAGATGTQGQQQRDVTADSFRRSPALLTRLRPWLRRELTVLYGAHGSLVEIVQRIITARLARHGLEDVPVIEEELRPFLLARTEHFLHELVSFARSPLSLDSYDLHAVYEPPAAAAMDMDWISSSSDSSSVIAISEGEEAEQEAAGGGAEGAELEAVDAAPHDVIQTGSCLSLSGWDDETPGPSYSTADQSCSLTSLPVSPAPQEAANQEAAEKEEECLIVGYKKPIAERTPELVQLSSDSEEEEQETKATPPPPPAAPPPSLLPTIPPSTSAAFRDEPDGRPRENDSEVAGALSRARSWSGSSGRSRNSVCTLSPCTPAGGEQRHDRATLRERRQTRERRRRRKRGGPERKSGTIYNPNRAIFPAMMRHRSPFRSSAESGSPTSPAASSWECPSSQLEALSSSDSSPSCSSSSPFCFSPPPLQTPPPTSPGNCEDGHHGHGEKPGGKRKYKSRHLDSDVKDPTWRPSGSQRREKRRRKGRSCGAPRRSREERSPSVEIIYEGTANDSRAPAGRRHRRRRRRAQRSSSPVIITLDSDSSHGNVNHRSSSPISSRRSVELSDLPPLPLVHPAAVGGALEAEIGELPVDILDRGSDGSGAEPSGSCTGGGVDAEFYRPMGAGEGRGDGEGSDPDRNLLTSILDDLRGLSARRPAPTFDPGCSPESRARRYRTPCEVGHDGRSPAGRPSLPAAPTLERRRLLQQAPPTLPFNRNTPPPLKHKDGGSPSVCLADRHSAPPCPSGGASLTVDKPTIPAFCTLRRLASGVAAARPQRADALETSEEAPRCDIASGGRCDLTPSPEEVSPPRSRTQTGSWPAGPLPPLAHASKPSTDQVARRLPLRPAPSPSDPPRPPSPPEPQNHLDPESGLQPPPKLDLLLRGASAGQSDGCVWNTDAHAAT